MRELARELFAVCNHTVDIISLLVLRDLNRWYKCSLFVRALLGKQGECSNKLCSIMRQHV